MISAGVGLAPGHPPPDTEARLAEFARPELIASPEWLAENLGRTDVRIVDLRWRPDGTAPAVYAAGHVPSAVRLDWLSSVVESADGSDVLALASPERMAATMSAAGIGDGTEVVHLRRHAGVPRGAGVVEPPRVRLRDGADPRRRVPGVGRRRAAASSEGEDPAVVRDVHAAGSSRGAASRPATPAA